MSGWLWLAVLGLVLAGMTGGWTEPIENAALYCLHDEESSYRALSGDWRRPQATYSAHVGEYVLLCDGGGDGGGGGGSGGGGGGVWRTR